MHVHFNVFSTLSLKRRPNTLTLFHCYINASAFCFSQLYGIEQSFSKDTFSVCTSTCSYLGVEEKAEHLTLVHRYIKSYSAQFSQLYNMTIAAFLKLLSSEFTFFFYSVFPSLRFLNEKIVELFQNEGFGPHCVIILIHKVSLT